ncbi:MAG: hypothetical protein V4658_00685 [Bacteroidota bacterium]
MPLVSRLPSYNSSTLYGNNIKAIFNPVEDGLCVTDKGSNAPDGVYFFILNASLSDDTPVKLTGSVQIIRGN